MTTLQTLPNSMAVLVLGIFSVIPFFYPFGLITGIIGIVLSTKGRRMYVENPNNYGGYKKLQAGYIMSIIGIVINGIVVFYLLIYGAGV